MPHPALVGDLLHRLDVHGDLEEMGDPGLQHPAQRVQAGPREREIEDRVVPFVASPVGVRVVEGEHVQLHRFERRSRLDHELAQAAEAAGGPVHLHRFRVRHQDLAVLDGRRLLAEKQLARPRPQGIGGFA